jgi:cytosine/uracil/thiamine/allantoin permease
MNWVAKYGLSTWQGTNIVGVLLAALEYAKTMDQDTQKWLLPSLWTALVLTFFLIRGNTAPAVAQELNDAGAMEVRDVMLKGKGK